MGLTYDELKFLKNEQEKSLARPSVNIRTPQSRIADLPTQSQEEFGTLEVLKAGFLEENTLASTVSTILNGNYGDQEEDPEYDIVGKLEGTKYEPYFENFVGQVYNDKQFEHIAGKIDREEERDRILDSAGGFGIVSRIAGAVFDPINLIPIGGTAYKSFKAGKTIKGAIRGAEVGVISETATESILQSQQETRTAQESVINIAGGALLGGAIGAGAGALSKADYDNLATKLQSDVQRQESSINIDAGGNLSAAKVEGTDPNLAGGAVTQGLIKSTAKLNPMLRVLQSSSTKAKETLPSLVRTNMYFKKNFNDIATDQSVEIEIKSFDAGLGRSIEGGKSIYKQFNKRLKKETGKPISIENFYDQVSLAMIRGDKSDIPEVEQVAKIYRKEVFDPLKEQAIETGLLPKDIEPKTATSYLMRKYNINKMVSKEKEFKDIIRRGARERLIPEIERELPVKFKNLKNIDEAIDKIDVKLAKADIETKAFDSLVNEKLSLLIAKGDEQAIDDYVDQITDSVFNNIRGTERMGVSMPYDIKVGVRGPAKERLLTFVKDEELRPFLETDITKLAKSYTRTMATDVALKRKFGDLNLKPQIREISREYDELRSKAKTEKERVKLDKEEKDVLRVINALKDVMRGDYGRPNNPDGFFVKAAQASRTINYMSKLGGVALSSIPDMARHIMVHGITRTFGKGLKTLVANTKAIKLSVKDAKLAGQLWESVTHQRASVMADLGNPYNGDSKFMITLDWMGQNFSKVNLLDAWNNYQKGFSSLLTQSRLIENIRNFDNLKPKEKSYMAFLGIDKNNISRLKAQISKNSFDEDGFPIANLEKWTDDEALRLYKNALNTDVDRTIVTKGVGDVPLLMNTEWGKTLLQFKSFAFAAHQQVLIAGLQQADAAAITGITVALTAGMMTYYLKQTVAGREVSDDPNVWVAEGLDRSGLLPVIMEINGVADVMGFGAGKMLGQQPLSRFATRNKVSGLLGPSLGQAQDIANISTAITNGEFTESDIKAIRRNIPFQNVFYLRQLFDTLEK
jgi:hypothetical protein